MYVSGGGVTRSIVLKGAQECNSALAVWIKFQISSDKFQTNPKLQILKHVFVSRKWELVLGSSTRVSLAYASRLVWLAALAVGSAAGGFDF